MEVFENWIVSKPFASRGLHDDKTPENSISAIQKAVDAGYGVAIEVRALADNTIVVFHDEALGRMTGTDGFIVNCTKEDIADLKLAKTDEHIPTLQEVLDVVDGKVPVIVEIRNMDKVSYEKYVWKILHNYKGDYAVTSYNPYSLEWFKINAPKVKRGQISCFFKGTDIPLSHRHSLKRMKFNKTISEPNFIIYRCQDLPNRFVKRYKDLPLLAYHVNSAEMLDRAQKHANNYIFDTLISQN